MNQKLPILYTLKECCSILKVGRNKMLELIWNGEIDAFKSGDTGELRKAPYRNM